jgi:hypothetical protein
MARALAAMLVVAALGGCELPLDPGLPTTRAVESGAAATLSGATSFELTGSFVESGAQSTLDLQVVRPGTEHLLLGSGSSTLEAIVVGPDAYFRGQQFLAQHMSSDPVSRGLVKAAGGGWWKGDADLVPKLSEFTEGTAFRSTFLGTATTQRTDHVSVRGVAAIEMSGVRADAYLAAAAPHQVLRLRLKQGVAVDGLTDVDFQYGNYNRDFKVAAPSDVIDFSNLSRAAPVYTVVSVDTSRCGSPCAVSALLKNLGGTGAARGHSSITFTVKAAASGTAVGTCTVPVAPDVGFNATTTAGCSIDLTGRAADAAVVTATVDNPGPA